MYTNTRLFIRSKPFLLACLAMSLFVMITKSMQKVEMKDQINIKSPTRISFEKGVSKTNVSSNMNIETWNLKSVLTKMKGLQRPLLVTFINDAYLPFAHNWLCNTIHMGIHEQVLLIATDEHSLKEVTTRWPKLNAISLSDDRFNGKQEFSHVGYLRMMARRTELILEILKEDVEILLYDLDTVWISNPLPECERRIQGSDILVIPVSDTPGFICGGFILMKPTEAMVRLWSKVTDMMHVLQDKLRRYEGNDYIEKNENDQVFVSQLLRKRFGGIRVEKLSLDQFPDGKWYLMKKEEREKLSPLVIHNNWILGNDAKIERMKQFHQWYWNSGTSTCNLDLVILQTASE